MQHFEHIASSREGPVSQSLFFNDKWQKISDKSADNQSEATFTNL